MPTLAVRPLASKGGNSVNNRRSRSVTQYANGEPGTREAGGVHLEALLAMGRAGIVDRREQRCRLVVGFEHAEEDGLHREVLLRAMRENGRLICAQSAFIEPARVWK